MGLYRFDMVATEEVKVRELDSDWGTLELHSLLIESQPLLGMQLSWSP